MKLNFNFDLTDSEGLVMAPAKKALAMVLERAIVQNDKVVIKYFDWALQLQKTGELEIDDADFKSLKEFIKENGNLPVNSKYHILKYFESVEK